MSNENTTGFLDLKLPLGCLIVFYGLVLTIYGAFFTDAAIYQKSLNININVVWGSGLLVLGAVLLLFSFLGRNKK
jgi:hypothetical protein